MGGKEANERTNWPASRPRAICPDLTGVEGACHPVPPRTWPEVGRRSPETFKDALVRLALETGLPMVLFTERPLRLPLELEEGRLPWMTVVQTEKGSGERTLLSGYIELAAHRFGIPARDVMCVTDRSSKDIHGPECRTVALRDAVQVLNALSQARRIAVFAGFQEITPEMVHTVLVPLDLGISATPRADLLCDHGRLKFDTVLLMEDHVPTSGFAAKSLEKPIAGYAPIVYGLADGRDLAEVFRDTISRLSAAGACRSVFVSNDGELGALAARFVAIAAKSGFYVALPSWDELIHLRLVDR